tara:strand:- start:6 stop:701 length:696 start_codon:yes stop_codon:yes gene_type:complete
MKADNGTPVKIRVQKYLRYVDYLKIKSFICANDWMYSLALDLCYYTGLRGCEAVAVQESDINFEIGIMMVRTAKNNQIREKKVPLFLLKDLKLWCDTNRHRFKNDFIFCGCIHRDRIKHSPPNLRGKHISADTLRRRFRSYLIRAGLDTHYRIDTNNKLPNDEVIEFELPIDLFDGRAIAVLRGMKLIDENNNVLNQEGLDRFFNDLFEESLKDGTAQKILEELERRKKSK